MSAAEPSHGSSRADRGARRWPAEWERQEALWLAWPHAPETWPERLEAVEATYAEMVRVLQGRTRLCIAIDGDARQDRARHSLRRCGVDPDDGIEFVALETDDAWLRDTGPIFVREGARRIALDFRFDSWGGKYPPWDRDDRVAEQIAAHMGVAVERVDCVLEGGAVDGNGAGAVLTTESCLLHPNRGAGRTRPAMEQLLRDRLGAEQVLWLEGGIAGDDTDGHVDDVARFVATDTVVAAVEPDPGDVNHRPLAANRDRLRHMRTATRSPLLVAEVPMPRPLGQGARRLPASHVNFLLTNGVALVPVFGGPSDERALAILRECLPDRDVIGVGASDLVIGCGAVHCLAQGVPSQARGGEI